jgi:hypothetical protein
MSPVLKKMRVTTITVIAWLVCIALSLEIYSRFAFESNSHGVHQLGEIVYEKEVGWIGLANLRAPSQHGSYPVAISVSINSDGFRDGDWDEKLQRVSGSHAKKILLIGDSMLYGWGSDSSERLTESLAHRYRLANVNVEIFNAGIPAYGASQERRLLHDYSNESNPISCCSYSAGTTMAIPRSRTTTATHRHACISHFTTHREAW